MSTASNRRLSDDIGFKEPLWNAPLAIEAYVQAAPSAYGVKGMFFTCITQLARTKSAQPLGKEHYTAFKSYPMREWLELLPQCAKVAYPHLPLRAALFETGSHIYRTFAESTVGRVVMSVAGRDLHAAIKLIARAYQSVGTDAAVTIASHEERRVVLELRNMWEYPDCYQAGVLAAGVRSYGPMPNVRVRSISLCDCDIELSW